MSKYLSEHDGTSYIQSHQGSSETEMGRSMLRDHYQQDTRLVLFRKLLHMWFQIRMGQKRDSILDALRWHRRVLAWH